ncbi:MAG: SCO family protein [Chloroflexi bacterium]|nr:SCO family protein [Chloroflexota bacterium]
MERPVADEPTPAGAPRGRRSPMLLLGLALLPLAILAGVLWAQSTAGAPALPVLWPAPAFALRDQHDRALSDADLRRRVVVANFIFTRCTDICPIYLTPKMRQVQRALAERGLDERQVMLLSFSVDPEHDTPAVLASYGERFGADGRTWRFLTGPLPAMELVAAGFKVAMERVAPPSHSHGEAAGAGPPTIAHSGRFFVLDGRWRVRALHLAEDVEPATIVRDAEALVREEGTGR